MLTEDVHEMIILSGIQALFDDSRRKRDYYLLYTVLFFILTFFCFSWFLFSGKSLIWQMDGWMQHFKALVYYGEYLKSIVRILISEHKLIIPDWDFCIGEGSDVINALHYYVIGDPIALFSVFVPKHYMQYFFSFCCILRLYLAGIAFSELCFGTGKTNRYAVMSGALSYCFCIWGLVLAARHPYFVNPMIYYPLMILGIEKIIQRKRPYLYIFTTAISAASNFYFFYMIVLATAGYALVRLTLKYRADIKKLFLGLFSLAGYAFIGVMIAGIIFLPVFLMILRDSRLSVPQPFHLFYPLSYYSRLPGVALSNQGRQEQYWLHLGLTAPVIFSVILLFTEKKKNTLLKILFGICMLIIIFPIGGRIFNGMYYMTNRWCWSLFLLCSYTLVCEWESLTAVTTEKWRLLFGSAAACYALCLLFDESRCAAALSSVPLLFMSLFILEKSHTGQEIRKESKALFLLFIIMAGLANTAFWEFSPGAGDYVSEFKENRKVWDEWENNEAVAVKSVSEDPYPRYSGRSLTNNVNTVHGISSTQYCWSLSNPYMNKYRLSLEMREPYFSSFQGYDDRTTPVTLAAVQYYTVKEKDNKWIPYGYESDGIVNADTTLPARLDELKRELKTNELTEAQEEKIETALKNNIVIYRNQNALPLGYCYDSVISPESWKKMNPVQKQESLLSAAYLEEDSGGMIKTADISKTDYTIPFEIKCRGNEITQTDSGFVTTANNTKIELTLAEEIVNSEVYIGFEGIEFEPTPEYAMYFGNETVDPKNLYNRTNWDILPRSSQIAIRKEKFYWNSVVNANITVESSAGRKNTISYKQPDDIMSSGRHDYIANLGYSEKPVSSITVTFPTRGVYTFDNIRVYVIPMDGYAEKVAKLRKNSLKNLKLGVDSIRGQVDADGPRIMCLAIPYSAGWTAAVDGTKTKVHIINEHYLGLYIPEGKHNIYLHYRMPYKREGYLTSLLGFLALAAVYLFERMKRKRTL